MGYDPKLSLLQEPLGRIPKLAANLLPSRRFFSDDLPHRKLPHPRRYRLLPNGYSICLVFLKLFERVYAPLTAGLLSPIKADAAGIMQVTIWKSSPLAHSD